MGIAPGRLGRNLAVLLIATLAAAGCFDASLDVTVDDDGSVSSVTRYVVHDDLLALGLLADEANSPQQVCDELLDEMSRGSQEPTADATAPARPLGLVPLTNELVVPVVERINDGETCAITETYAWSSQVTEKFMMLEGFPLSRTEDGGWRFSLDLAVGEPTGSTDGIEQLDAIGVSPPTGQVMVTLPGYAHSHNAALVEGSTYTWQFTVADMPTEPLFAETRGTSEAQPDLRIDETGQTEPILTEDEGSSENASDEAHTMQLPASEVEPGTQTVAGPPTGTTAATQLDETGATAPASENDRNSGLVFLIALGAFVLGGCTYFVASRVVGN